MKLEKKKSSRGGRPGPKVRVTDPDGEVMEFETGKEAARFLDVSPCYVSAALKYGYKCRGCRVERHIINGRGKYDYDTPQKKAENPGPGREVEQGHAG